MSAQPAEDAVEVRLAPDRDRFEVVVGGEVAGFAAYRREGEAYAFTHTEIREEFEGQGLGSRLVGAALRELAGTGAVVLPYCPFVRSYLARHRDLAGLVPADRAHEFGLP